MSPKLYVCLTQDSETLVRIDGTKTPLTSFYIQEKSVESALVRYLESLLDSGNSVSLFVPEKHLKNRLIIQLQRLSSIAEVRFLDVNNDNNSAKLNDFVRFEKYQQTGSQDVFLCDIDGTLALLGDREVYDSSKAHLDHVIHNVAEVVKTVNQSIAPVIFISGRSENHRQVTMDWLESHGFEIHGLYLRQAHDYRPDDLVKYEIVQQFQGKVNILGVFDDRPKVVRMWQAMGLTTFNVGILGHEF